MDFTQFLGIFLVCCLGMLSGNLLAYNRLGVMIPTALSGVADE
jgi:hypothetical protein